MALKSSVKEKWDKTADVVVVGYGSAGAATAITAHDAGARVLILEKAPEAEVGGNSRVAAQGWLNPYPVDKAVTYFKALNGPYTVPEAMVRVGVEEMGRNTEWVKGLDSKANPVAESEIAEFPELPGADCVHIYNLDGKRGNERLWKILKAAVDRRGIEVMYETPGKELVQNYPGKEILGVRAGREGKLINVKANRAVVLTCGGFQNNQEMLRNFVSDLPYCYPLGTPYNTGDGITMAMEVGADLWHMNFVNAPWYSFKAPEFPAIFELTPLHYAREVPGGMIFLGADGKRFVDEKHKTAHGRVKVHEQWVQSPTPCPMFLIFDHTMFSAGPLYDNNFVAGWNQILKVYNWSDDNSAEMARGWIKKASTVAELASRIGLDPAAVQQSVNTWNTSCAGGKDIDFGRTRMLSPIKVPPFYAMDLAPVFINTLGGPRRNEKSQVVRPNGTPIPRLYSAGELGSIFGFRYQGAGNIAECLAFGRISGRNAAAEKPWG